MKLPRPSLALFTAAALLGGNNIGFGQTAPTTPETRDEETLKLDPFTVSADSDVGFVAASSLAGGRISTALKDTPVAYSVITKEFLEAFNITNIAEAGNWTTNADYTNGDNTNYGYGGNESSSIRVRGLTVNSPTRNFFSYNSTSDSFNVDRVDFARGANAVLFGAGGAGGTQNTGTKQANTNRNLTEFRVQVGSYNKYRLTLDVNRTLTPKLAIRANVVWSSQDSFRDRLWEDKRGFHVTGTYKLTPKLTLRGEFEYLTTDRSTAVYQFRDFVSAWDGRSYDFNAPLSGSGAPSAASLAQMGIARTPQRFVSHPDFDGMYMNFQNRFRTTGLQQNTTSPNYFQGQPIRTVGWTVRAQSMIDGNTGIPDPVRYASVLAGSPFFQIPTREDTPLWDDPHHQYPVNGQKSRDAAFYVNYAPFRGFFIELAADANEGRGKGNTAQRRGMQEFYLDIMKTLPDGRPNLWFLHTYQERGHYKQARENGRDSLRLQSVYVKETRIGKFQVGAMGGITLDKVHNRSSELMLPLNWITPDARSWIANGELNEYFVWDRLYTDDRTRPENPAWSGGRTGGRAGIVLDPVTGVRATLTPVWMWDARREDNVYDSKRNSKFVQFAGNFDLFKNRLVLIGAFRRDFTNFTQNRIKNPGDYPVGWDGVSLILREPAPADYETLTYLEKDAAGKVTNPNPTPADTRPRITIQGASVPVAQYANDRFRDDFDSPDVRRSKNTGTLGAVVNVKKWLGVFANHSTTYSFGQANQSVWNKFLPPTVSEGRDAGVRVTLPNNRLSFSAGVFRAYQDGAFVAVDGNFLSAYNAIGDAPPVGDLTGRNVRNFARFRTNNIGSTQTSYTTGYEFELTANLRPNWRLTANYGTSGASARKQNVDLVEYFTYADPIVRQILADAGVVIDPATNQASINPAVDDPTKINQSKVQAAANGWNSLVNNVIPTISARPGQKNAVLQSVPFTANLATDYRFRTGPLDGVRLGFGVNLRGRQRVGNRGGDTIRNPNNPSAAIDDPSVDALTWVTAPGYWTSTGSMSYTIRLKETRKMIPRSVQFDLTINNLQGRNQPVYGYTSTGGQNTNGTNFVPNDGTLQDPSRHSVPGNFFYLEPRGYTLSAKMNF